MTDLPVCSKCGWHSGFSHASECSPAQGRHARALMERLALSEITCSQLGYGYGRVNAEIAKDFHVTFYVGVRGHYSVDRPGGFFCLERMDLDAAANLVVALRNWWNDYCRTQGGSP